MTSITFPLKKFPGQIEHNHIGFTGRIMFHPIILAVLVLFQSSFSVKYGFMQLGAYLSFVPLLFVILFYSVYLINFHTRGSDYFGLSLENFEAFFEEDRIYFKQMFSFGLVLSFVVWIASLQYSLLPELSQLVVNSILLLTYFIHTTMEGMYAPKKLFRVLLNYIILEVIFWSILVVYPTFDIALVPVLFLSFYKSLRRFDNYKPIQLLQKIIS